MLYNIYTIYDKTADEHGSIFIAVNDGVAKRAYKNAGIPDALRDEYQLRMLGTFDSKTGDVIPEIQYTVEEEINNG